VNEHSADAASFTTELLRRLNDPSPDPNVELLLSEVDSGVDFVDVTTTMLAAARIPARLVRGFELSGRQISSHGWRSMTATAGGSSTRRRARRTCRTGFSSGGEVTSSSSTWTVAVT
jgi:hypothetical protein